ncbi:MAG: hypothetical protein M3P49_10850 [Actinomycetota bacterium]|nr:hypothetical protein [Actinomycetota bacterium]
MILKFSIRKIIIVLTITISALTLASLGQHFLEYMWGRADALAIPRRFNVGEDANVPTWYSSVVLLLCSVLLAMIAAAKRNASDRYSLHWAFLSIIFLLLSLDEVATIHEAVGDTIGSAFKLVGVKVGGLLYAAWVIPGAIFIFIVLIAYLRFLADLPKSTRRLFLVAGTLFVIGAIGMEMLSARLSSFYGWENLESMPVNIKIVIALQTAVEELLEMCSTVVLLYALLAYARSHVEKITIQINDR